VRPSLWSLIRGFITPVYPSSDLDATHLTFSLRAAGYVPSPRWPPVRVPQPKRREVEDDTDWPLESSSPGSDDKTIVSPPWLCEAFTREELWTLNYEQIRERLRGGKGRVTAESP
jgi:hypothetical protein